MLKKILQGKLLVAKDMGCPPGRVRVFGLTRRKWKEVLTFFDFTIHNKFTLRCHRLQHI